MTDVYVPSSPQLNAPFLATAIADHDKHRPQHEPFITLRRKSIAGNLSGLELQASVSLYQVVFKVIR
jgi:hypothetical protein